MKNLVNKPTELSGSSLPELKIKGKKIRLPIIQGGMGVGVSLHRLASAVAVLGAAGVVSSAALDVIVSARLGRKVDAQESAYCEITEAKQNGGYIGINIMVALVRDYEASVKGALDAGVDAIISGAGLPLSLPSIQPPRDTALIPIISSARALEVVCKKWERLGYRPDAVVLEGPLAGGHIGFQIDQWQLPGNALENLFPPVKDTARKHGDFPVIVAGGIYSHDDILRFIALGADGVQMGTRFLATHESSATDSYKQAVVEATADDILVSAYPCSPCGLPFRLLAKSPLYIATLKQTRLPICNKGYVLQKDSDGHLTKCAARMPGWKYFCICNGLISSAGHNDGEGALYTVGAIASRVDKIIAVRELIDELSGAVSLKT